MVKLGAKSPYVTSMPNSSRCSTCRKPGILKPKPTPTPVDPCPKIPKNPNYQLCSPWPQFGGCTHINNNWRSSPFSISTFKNTITNVLADSINVGESFESSPVMDANGIIYCFSASLTGKTALYSYNPSTKMLKRNDFIGDSINTGESFVSSPVIDSNGIIYCFSGSISQGDTGTGSLYSYNPSTKMLKKNDFSSGSINTGDSFTSSPVIDSNGILYCFSFSISQGGTGGSLYSYNPSTKMLKRNDFIGDSINTGESFVSSPVIDSNGIIYCFSGSISQGDTGTGSLYSYNPSTKMLKKNDFSSGSINTGDSFTSSPVIDSNGILYCFSFSISQGGTGGSLYSYNPSTKMLKRNDFIGDSINTGESFESSPVIDSNGIIYCFSELFTGTGSLYSYNPSTKILKRNDFSSGSINSGESFQSSPVIDSNGILYCYSRVNSQTNIGSLYSYNPSTTTLTNISSYKINYSNIFYQSSPLIDSNNNIYYFLANTIPL